MQRKTDTAFLIIAAIAGATTFVGRLFSSGGSEKRRRIDVGRTRKVAGAALSARDRTRRRRPS